MSIEERLQQLGITLPIPPQPIAAYVPFLSVNDFLYTSGALPMLDGALRYRGTVGADIDIDDAVAAARLCALNIVALIRSAVSLDSVHQVVQISGFVRSAPGFDQQSKVLNGASELFVDIFGDRGKHTRTAVGVTDLPLGAVVEISAIVHLQ